MRIVLASATAIALVASGAIAQGIGSGRANGNSGDGQLASVQQQSDGVRNDSGTSEPKADRRAKAARDPQQNRGFVGSNESGRTDDANKGAKGQSADSNPVNTATSASNDDSIRTTEQHTGKSDLIWPEQDYTRGPIAGCPPGLATKENGCKPPGQTDNRYYERSIFGYEYRPPLFGLTHYGNGRYHLRDGYLVQYGEDGISNWIPLLGGALAVGHYWPVDYPSYNLPDCYIDYFNLGGEDRYRYADNVIYRVDPADAAINSITALLTGDEVAVGQPMPAGYDVYNVPKAYRDRYYDTPRAQYRYFDGHIYQIDPETQLVTAIIDMLV